MLKTMLLAAIIIAGFILYVIADREPDFDTESSPTQNTQSATISDNPVEIPADKSVEWTYTPPTNSSEGQGTSNPCAAFKNRRMCQLMSNHDSVRRSCRWVFVFEDPQSRQGKGGCVTD
jgi:hypothetical protein